MPHGGGGMVGHTKMHLCCVVLCCVVLCCVVLCCVVSCRVVSCRVVLFRVLLYLYLYSRSYLHLVASYRVASWRIGVPPNTTQILQSILDPTPLPAPTSNPIPTPTPISTTPAGLVWCDFTFCISDDDGNVCVELGKGGRREGSKGTVYTPSVLRLDDVEPLDGLYFFGAFVVWRCFSPTCVLHPRAGTAQAQGRGGGTQADKRSSGTPTLSFFPCRSGTPPPRDPRDRPPVGGYRPIAVGQPLTGG